MITEHSKEFWGFMSGFDLRRVLTDDTAGFYPVLVYLHQVVGQVAELWLHALWKHNRQSDMFIKTEPDRWRQSIKWGLTRTYSRLENVSMFSMRKGSCSRNSLNRARAWSISMTKKSVGVKLNRGKKIPSRMFLHITLST